MNETLQQNIQHAFETLMDAEKEFDKKKCQILINAFENADANSLIAESLRKNGLPKTIFVSDDCSKDTYSHLMWFAPVRSSSAFPKGNITFSWVEIFDGKMADFIPFNI